MDIGAKDRFNHDRINTGSLLDNTLAANPGVTYTKSLCPNLSTLLAHPN